MKKLLMAVFLCGALILTINNSVFAEEVCGWGYIEYIVVHESNDADVPVEACEVGLWFYDGRDEYYIEATAFGTQINNTLALLSMSWGEASLCIDIRGRRGAVIKSVEVGGRGN